eukprot:510267_1
MAMIKAPEDAMTKEESVLLVCKYRLPNQSKSEASVAVTQVDQAQVSGADIRYLLTKADPVVSAYDFYLMLGEDRRILRSRDQIARGKRSPSIQVDLVLKKSLKRRMSSMSRPSGVKGEEIQIEVFENFDEYDDMSDMSDDDEQGLIYSKDNEDILADDQITRLDKPWYHRDILGPILVIFTLCLLPIILWPFVDFGVAEKHKGMLLHTILEG